MDNERFLNVEAVVIKRKNLKEADKLLTLFTKELGRVMAIAKGVRKINSRRSGHLEIFSHVRLSLHKSKTGFIITEAEKIEDFANNLSLNQISYLYYICEIVDRLCPERQIFLEIFNLLTTTIYHIRKTNSVNNYNQSTYNFALLILKDLGFLDDKKLLVPKQIPNFIENIIERRLLTPKVIRKMISAEITS